MFQNIVRAAPSPAPTPANPASGYGTSGLNAWINDNAISLLLLVAAVAVLWAGKSGNIPKGITIVAGVLLGLLMLGLATGNNAQDMGNFIFGLIKN